MARGKQTLAVALVVALVVQLLPVPALAQTLDADLIVTLTADFPSLLSGNIATFTLQVVNRGPDAARQTQVRMLIPNGSEFVSAEPSQGTCREFEEGHRNVICTVGRLGPSAGNNSASVAVRVRATMKSGRLKTLAAARTTSVDPNTDNNFLRTTVDVLPRLADLSVTMTAADAVSSGGFLNYTIEIANAGPRRADNTRLRTHVPEGTTFWSISPSKGSCTAPEVGATGVISCNVGKVAAGTTVDVGMVVRVTARGGVVTGHAIAVSDATDTVRETNKAAASTTVTPRQGDVVPPQTLADVTVVQFTNPIAALSGKDLTYTLSVASGGPDTAHNVVLSDTLPQGVRFVSIATSRGSCNAPPVGSTGHVRCTLGDMQPRETATVTVVVNVKATGGEVQNAARLTHSTFTTDPLPKNNSSLLALPVRDGVIVTGSIIPVERPEVISEIAPSPPSDLWIIHTHELQSAIIDTSGRIVRAYKKNTVRFGNDGPADANNVNLSVAFASGVTFEQFTAPSPCPPSMDTGRLVIACSNVGTIQAGQSGTIEFVTSVVEGELQADPLKVDLRDVETLSVFDIRALGFDNSAPAGPLESAFLTASSVARVGTADLEFNTGNNMAPILVHLKSSTEVLKVVHDEECEEKDSGKFGVLLDLGCDSPISVVDAWMGALTAAILGATGIVILDYIILTTVIAVFVAAESAVLV